MRLFSLLAAFIAVAPVASAAAPGLKLTVQSHKLVASNATKGSQVVFFGDQIDARAYSADYFHGANVVDVGDDGSCTFDIGRGVGPASVWIAIDLATGDTDVITGDGLHAREYIPTADALKHDFNGNTSKLQLPFLIADVLLVRPKDGAWLTTVADGGSTDDDRNQDGKTTVQFETLLETSKNHKAPRAIVKGDVLIAVHPRTLQYMIVKVKS
jgi:hypothetical protein